MSKPLWCYTLLTGFILLLLAMVLALHTQSPRQANTALRVQVTTALANLNRCDNCHPPTLATQVQPQALALVHHMPVLLPLSRSSVPQNAIDAELRALGQRLISVPATNEANYASAADHFVATYAQTRSDRTQRAAVHTRIMLRDLRKMVNALEYQAAPYHWAQTASLPIPDQTVTLQPAPVPVNGKWTAVSHAAQRLNVPSAPAIARLSDISYHAADESVVVAQRRGPPVMRYGWDSYDEERLPVAAVQSLSFFAVNTHPVARSDGETIFQIYARNLERSNFLCQEKFS